MIQGNERLVIISGMAHSGTTILAYLLAQHPDLFLVVDGWQAPLLESDLLIQQNAYAIQWLLNANPRKRILLKRPWYVRAGIFLLWELPQAKYLYCVRDFPAIATSWRKPTSLVTESLRNRSEQYQQAFYRMSMSRALDFGKKAPHFRQVAHADLLADPGSVISDIADWLGLAPFQFDTSAVGHDDIKEIISSTPK